MELLEDLHTGTGMGQLGLLDDTQSRDQRGRPVVWASTIRGLLREVARDIVETRRLAELPVDRAQHERGLRLFGWRGNETAQAVVCSLRLMERNVPLQPPPFTTWASTAREPFGRRPNDHSLRFIEFARAGLTFEGAIRFQGEVSQDDIDFFENCLRRFVALGRGKTRGWGRARLVSFTPEILPIPDAQSLPYPSTHEPTAPLLRLRLLLRNLEPLCLARTAYAGNLIGGQNFIPGATLRGAILRWLSSRGHFELAEQLVGTLYVSNAYALPDEPIPDNWQHLEVLPMPLSVKEPKGGGDPCASDTPLVSAPWWATPGKQPRYLHTPAGDALAGTAKEWTKRVKTDEYLVRNAEKSAHWRRVLPKMGVLLRNAVPTRRLDPQLEQGAVADSRLDRLSGRQDDALFSENVLWEGQLFLADLCFERGDLARQVVEAGASLLAGPVKYRSWLRLGRKGRPVEIIATHWANSRQQPGWRSKGQEATEGVVSSALEAPDPDSLTLTLTSDLIARTPWLTYSTTFDLNTLSHLAVQVGETPPSTAGIHQESRSEAVEVYGFNSATGLPRTPALALRRGSVLRLRADQQRSSAGQANLACWRELLQRMHQLAGLGERTVDGFGHYTLDLDVHTASYWNQEFPIAALRHPPPGHNWRECVLERVEQFLIKETLDSGDSLRKEEPSVTQWQWLRNIVRALKTADELDHFLSKLPEEVNRLGARKQWRSIVATLSETARQAGDTLEQRVYFVDMLVQGAVARLRAGRDRLGIQV